MMFTHSNGTEYKKWLDTNNINLIISVISILISAYKNKSSPHKLWIALVDREYLEILNRNALDATTMGTVGVCTCA